MEGRIARDRERRWVKKKGKRKREKGGIDRKRERETLEKQIFI